MNFLNHSELRSRGSFLKKAGVTLAIVVTVVASGAAGYFYLELNKVRNSNAAANASDDVTETIAAVSKLIVLPSGEQPTVATVTDPEKLKDQAFFASAQKGDKVLIFKNAKKAILYRSSENKIVEVAPVSIGENVGGTSTDKTNK